MSLAPTPGHGSMANIRQRLQGTETTVEQTVSRVADVESRTDVDELDPGDLTVIFDNKLT